MKKNSLYTLACLGVAALLAAGCSGDDAAGDFVEPAAATFRISTRAEGVNDATQLTRLYIGERKPEHASEALHCNRVVDIKNRTWKLTDLKPQWYKFVFLCVPKIDGTGEDIFTEETPGDGSCDMNKLMVDYTPVLNQAPGTEFPNVPTPDGDIFRKVENYWLQSGNNTINVELNRLNGQLVIDMGVLEDQFEHEVTQITLQVEDTPTRLYITDNDVDEIKTADPKTFTWTTTPDKNDFTQGDPENHHKLTVNLLPGTLSGSITVTTTGGEFSYPLTGLNAPSLSIKQNTRTVLEFNGVQDNYFTVRYAGYANIGIDVDDDEWDGWQDENND